jgi:uncharacterized protein YndB with AHSA1/START domain
MISTQSTIDIRHRIGVADATPDDVYAALTTIEGLSGWWAENTVGDAGLGGEIEFHFDPGDIAVRVLELDPPRAVRWEVVGGPDEWLGSTVDWTLDAVDGFTIVVFAHRGWRESSEFLHHCSTKWATFLLSLKQLVETGTGAPDPRDLRLGDWH